ncbi:MAG TPA: UBP-type zinc finger domain-containing protein [Gemmataceae bacterium]|nr:UBP-type zinc finger domain-containing protein [Gemmataceae bacterium]
MTCPHVCKLVPVAPRTPQGCEECLKTGTRSVHLRLCLMCGHVGCCDSSPNRYATKHFRHAGHPIVASFGPGERWAWCYTDEEGVPVPAAAEQYLRD